MIIASKVLFSRDFESGCSDRIRIHPASKHRSPSVQNIAPDPAKTPGYVTQEKEKKTERKTVMRKIIISNHDYFSTWLDGNRFLRMELCQ